MHASRLVVAAHSLGCRVALEALAGTAARAEAGPAAPPGVPRGGATSAGGGGTFSAPLVSRVAVAVAAAYCYRCMLLLL